MNSKTNKNNNSRIRSSVVHTHNHSCRYIVTLGMDLKKKKGYTSLRALETRRRTEFLVDTGARMQIIV